MPKINVEFEFPDDATDEELARFMVNVAREAVAKWKQGVQLPLTVTHREAEH